MAAPSVNDIDDALPIWDPIAYWWGPLWGLPSSEFWDLPPCMGTP